jgi:serine protease AprX
MTAQGAQKGSGARGSALRGNGRSAVLLAIVALLAPAAASAAPAAKPPTPTAFVPANLLAAAKAGPAKKLRVIVQLRQRGDENGLASKVKGLGKLNRRFRAISGVSAELPGAAIVVLARLGDVLAITPDAPVRKTDFAPAQAWPATVGADALWPTSTSAAGPKPPTIAVVDSGIDTSRTDDFGDRVVASVGFSQFAPGATGDGSGHGTFVASMAAGASHTHPGVAPTADLVNLRVMDDNGMALTSDVIAAADWILQNKDRYDIRVANFSLMSASPGSFEYDPLDRAVERLWFAGVTVVAAAGNQGDGKRQHMFFAPANDPFVITVGAAGTQDTADTADDDIGPFSAFGYTADGFAKPEVSAPGRVLVGAVSPGATLYAARPDRVVEPGYMSLSGTSFAAPVVAGAAAELLARHPDWTPDQVKGALMATARGLNIADPLATGAGEIDLTGALAVAAPTNPNAGLDRFVVDDDASGGKAFDAAGWDAALTADPTAWSEVSWSEVSWSEVSWSEVSWSEVSWSEAANVY